VYSQWSPFPLLTTYPPPPPFSYTAVWGQCCVLVVCVCVCVGGVVLCRCVCVCDLLIFFLVYILPQRTDVPCARSSRNALLFRHIFISWAQVRVKGLPPTEHPPITCLPGSPPNATLLMLLRLRLVLPLDCLPRSSPQPLLLMLLLLFLTLLTCLSRALLLLRLLLPPLP